MANAQGGQGQPTGQGGHGQTFTSAQHDASLGRESTGPGSRHEGDAPRVMDGAEATIQPPEGGMGDADSAPQSDMSEDRTDTAHGSRPAGSQSEQNLSPESGSYGGGPTPDESRSFAGPEGASKDVGGD